MGDDNEDMDNIDPSLPTCLLRHINYGSSSFAQPVKEMQYDPISDGVKIGLQR